MPWVSKRSVTASSAWSPRPTYGRPPERVAKPLLPPSAGAPIEQLPIGVTPRFGQLAPPPLIDRYPIVIGQNLSLGYVSQVFRLATTGYRQQYVDLLDELLEQDPHLYSVVQKRILAVANGRLEIVPAELPEKHPKKKRADELAEWVSAEYSRIPDLTQVIAALLWGGYYGVSGTENNYTKDGDGWHIKGLSFVQSRRLAYPDPQAWDLYIWDQGQVYGWQAPWGATPTNQSIFGLRVADFPGKFTIYWPQLRGDYPTRDGYGRSAAVWSVLKRIGSRNASMYLERFSKPFLDISCATQNDGNPREATDDDIQAADNAVNSLGVGSLASYVHPDSITVELLAADAGRPKMTFAEWITICNGEMSKCVLGSTLGTEVGKTGGNRALGEVMERGELDLEQYDAKGIGQTFDRDVTYWLVRLNRPGDLDILPHAILHVEKDPDPKTLLANIWLGVQAGMPIDADWAADETGLQLVEKDDPEKPRRLYKSDFADPMQVDPDLQSEEAKQAEADDKAQQAEIAKQKVAGLNGATNGAGPKAPQTPKPPAPPASQGH